MDRQTTTGTMSDADLAQLLSQVRAGDTDAWGEMYRQFAPAIFRFCRRLLPAREDAEDGNIHEGAPKTRDVRFVAPVHRVAL
jgi:hypothetical protein